MRRTALSAVALACTAVLAGAAPALAEDGTPTPKSDQATVEPKEGSSDKDATVEPKEGSSDVEPGSEATPVPDDQVTVVPKGGADTGSTSASTGSGAEGGLIGGAAAVLVGGGAAAFVVRRRRATQE